MQSHSAAKFGRADVDISGEESIIPTLNQLTPTAIVWWVFLLSLAMYGIFAIDKRVAIKQRSRISERTLLALALALAGRWPGGFLRQQLPRHQTRKVSFLVRFWIAAECNTAFVVWALV